MAHESFEDAETAAVMNRLFVNIKVDREERPDLDTVYQQALAVMGQQGGWPLTMFLTPEGEPFWGGTYFPPEPRYGRPASSQVLEQIAELWRSGERPDREQPRRDRPGAAARWPSRSRDDRRRRAGASRLARAIARTVRRRPRRAGRRAQVPPGAYAAPDLGRRRCARGDITLRQPSCTRSRASARAASTTIWAAASPATPSTPTGSCRTSRRCSTTTPNCCELLGFGAVGDAASRCSAGRAEETVAWLRREMMVEGAFAASLDADSEGEEGRYYVWEAAEIDRAAGR